MTKDAIVLRAKKIRKEYGFTVALNDVDFELVRGKVTTLFGENGAGKSTLMKILAGIEKPTAGSLELDGSNIAFDSSTSARSHGISIIHQELSLAPNLTVRDNMFLGSEIRSYAGKVNFAAENEKVREIMKRLQHDIQPDEIVGDLRLGQQQIVEIARALASNARILIMDEPTSALSNVEIEILFSVIEDLKSHGVSIVYISHHLEEALHVADYIYVLRDSNMIATDEAKNVDIQAIVRLMIGRDSVASTAVEQKTDQVVLELKNLSIADPSNPARLAVDDFSLKVHAGEVVCLYGQMGAGRTELLETIAGRIHQVSGEILLNGADISSLSIGSRIREGIALVPEDRQRDGLVQLMSVGHNIALSSVGDFVKKFLMRSGPEVESVEQKIKDVRVKTSSHKSLITSLSGGNQQKVVIGKVLLTSPKAIILDEPTRGIDVGAKAEIFKLLSEQAKSGLAVLFATSEISEAMASANRIVVLSKGQITAEMDPKKVTQSDVMSAADDKSSKKHIGVRA
jgi:erythritol transport system ATP-binding protein